VAGHAAQVAGISRQLHYEWMNEPPGEKADAYREAFAAARETAIDLLEQEAWRRAKEGIPKGIYYHGAKVDVETEDSDTLLKFLLQGRRRDAFGTKTEISGPDGGPVHITTIERVIVDPKGDS